MIDVRQVIDALPHVETFCSVRKLHELTEHLRRDQRFTVEIVGTSAGGVPIYHVRFGSGAVKALVVAGPHAPEPVGSVTVFGLMALLSQGNRALLDADVEWHILPCIDPDGALLNEGWTQKPFTFESFARNLYLQAPADQVDTSFPLRYKNLVVAGPPSREAAILQKLLERIRPDFYFSLHNTFAGGLWCPLSRDIGAQYYHQIYSLLDELRFPIRSRPNYTEFLQTFERGMVEIYSITKHYDFLERTTPAPEEALRFGASSSDYLLQIKPAALCFVAEMGYFQHPSEESQQDTGESLRRFKLRMEAESKFLATVMLEQWQRVEEDVDRDSPFYRALVGYVLPTKEQIVAGGMPVSRYPTRDTLFNPAYDRTMTEADRFDACVVNEGVLKLLPLQFQFLRLLQASPQTAAVRAASVRLERAFGAAFDQVDRLFDLSAIRAHACDTLAKVQLGSGLIALNSVLESVAQATAARSVDR